MTPRAKTPSAIELSSTDGRPIAVDVAATPGKLVHTAVSSGGAFDTVVAIYWHTDPGAPHVVTLAFRDSSGAVIATSAQSVAALSGPVDLMHGVPWRMRNGTQIAIWDDSGAVGFVKIDVDQISRP